MTDQDRQAIVLRLRQLVQELYAETDGLVESESDLQLWYNRGYANGLLKALRDMDLADGLVDLITADPDDYMVGQEFLPWGKAYRHGFEMGEKETREVL